jgi:16S rRNA (uracil1498-N3)-methyltransferase
MKIGDAIEVTDSRAIDYSCVIDSISPTTVFLRVIDAKPSDVEAPQRVSLFQALVKHDKMDTVIQKAVELGVSDIYPVAAERSIVKLDGESEKKKLERWNKISLEASKQ